VESIQEIIFCCRLKWEETLYKTNTLNEDVVQRVRHEYMNTTFIFVVRCSFISVFGALLKE